MRASRISTTAVALLAVIGPAAACQRGAAPAAPSDPRADAARLQRTNAQLQRQIELAAGTEFYLVSTRSMPVLR